MLFSLPLTSKAHLSPFLNASQHLLPLMAKTEEAFACGSPHDAPTVSSFFCQNGSLLCQDLLLGSHLLLQAFWSFPHKLCQYSGKPKCVKPPPLPIFVSNLFTLCTSMQGVSISSTFPCQNLVSESAKLDTKNLANLIKSLQVCHFKIKVRDVFLCAPSFTLLHTLAQVGNCSKTDKCTNVHQMYTCKNLYQMYKCTSKAKYLSECVEFVWDLVLISALTFQCTHKALPCFNYD